MSEEKKAASSDFVAEALLRTTVRDLGRLVVKHNLTGLEMRRVVKRLVEAKKGLDKAQ